MLECVNCGVIYRSRQHWYGNVEPEKTGLVQTRIKHVWPEVCIYLFICLFIYFTHTTKLHMAQLMLLPLTVSGFSKIQIGFTFLVPARKLAYYGHTMRKQGSCLEKEIMQGTMPGARRRGRPRTAWMDILATSRRGQDSSWKSQSEWQRTEMNGECTSMVWPTLGLRTAKEQNRTGWPG